MSELDKCRDWIGDALKYARGTHTVDDVIDGIKAGSFQLWPSDRGCIVTQIVNCPRKRSLNFFLAGGEMDQIKDMYASCVEFAKANGCTALLISGRKGWQRVWKSEGFEPVYTVLGKDI